MKMEQIVAEIKNLASSQGFYGRMYEALMEDEDLYQQAKEEWEAQNFKDIIDFILYIEC